MWQLKKQEHQQKINGKNLTFFFQLLYIVYRTYLTTLYIRNGGKAMRYKFVSVIVLIISLLFLSIEIPVQGSRPPDSLLQETYPIESSSSGAASEVLETYPIEEVSTPQPTPKAPFIYNPALVTEDTIGVLSSGELINRNEEIELFKLEHTNADGFVEVPPFIPPGKGKTPFPGGISYDPLGGVISPDAVIGTDDRILVVNLSDYLPYSAIVYLEILWDENQPTSWCTGWLVGPSSVITAAHCIYDATRQPYATPVRVRAFPGMSTGSVNPTPYAMCPEFERWVPYEWVVQGQSRYWDYGVYRLACRVGDYTGYFGFMQTVDNNQLVELAGYPDQVDGLAVPLGSMYTTAGNVTIVKAK
ncbi:MAG: trypsin-like serine protease [Anaerolineaceae bacterium]